MNYQEYIAGLLDDNKERDEFFQYLDSPLLKSISLLTHRLGIDDFQKIADTYQRELTKPSINQQAPSWHIQREDKTIPLGNHWLHQCGYFYMQEIAAGLPASIVPPRTGALVLDMCAAPGGKTSQLASHLLTTSKPGLVVANDIQYKRIISLQTNVNRVGCYNTAITKINGFSFGKAVPELFDHVLLDAPCSGEGTSFRGNSATQFWKHNEVKKIANTQYQLLISAFKSCKVGGSIIYSTCTINHLENEGNIQRFLKEYGEYIRIEKLTVSGVDEGIVTYNKQEVISPDQAKKCIRCRPHRQHTGGFFVTHFIKTKSLSGNNDKIQASYNAQFNTSPAIQNSVKQYLSLFFGIDTNNNHYFVEVNNTIYLTTPVVEKILPYLRCEKVGIAILKKTNHSFRPLHGLAVTLGHLATKHIIELTAEQTQAYTQLQTIPLADIQDTLAEPSDNFPYRLLTHQGLPISITKITDTILKNKFIRVG